MPYTISRSLYNKKSPNYTEKEGNKCSVKRKVFKSVLKVVKEGQSRTIKAQYSTIKILCAVKQEKMICLAPKQFTFSDFHNIQKPVRQVEIRAVKMSC